MWNPHEKVLLKCQHPVASLFADVIQATVGYIYGMTECLAHYVLFI